MLHGLQNDVLDVLVVGGGIVGAGIARDAAMRGLRTGLIEQRDFAFGTSSRSTRLLHGGLRYLAQGRIKLVSEASREKMVLHRIAPHLSQPLAFVFPARTGVKPPRWQLSLGAKLYDLLSRRGGLWPSKTLSPQATRELIPTFDAGKLTGAVRYFDGFTNDARLVLDTLRSAAANGATICNYAEFTDARRQGDTWTAQVVDWHTDNVLTANTRCIVNATGPWSDSIPGSKTSLRLTKGVHLVVEHSRFPLRDAVVTVDGDRILFAIPWGERTILGTTDTDYDGPLDAPTCDREDVDYLLDAINRDFPAAGLTESDVRGSWAGLRPLVADRHGNPSDISRRHEIRTSHPGWWDVVGGKLTIYRLMAEQTVNAIARHLQKTPVPCKTATIPLLSGESSEFGSGILPPECSQEVVTHYCHHEWARHLDDVMVRRTSWLYYHDHHMEMAERVAHWMERELGWTSQQTSQELHRYRTQYGS